jgi:hypothetical protein
VNSRVRRFPVVLLPVFGAWLCLASRAQTGPGAIRVVDPMRVRGEGSAHAAVLALDRSLESESVSCDVLVVGASTGGVAAALAAAQGNHTVCLTEETYWIGGQMTAQGVSALDDNQYVETSGGTASYRKARDAIRHHYRQQYELSNTGARQRHFNPGNCWVSALCFEPRVAFDVLKSMLQPYLANRFLRVFLRTKAVSGERSGNTISSVLAYDFENRRWIEFHTRYVLDARTPANFFRWSRPSTRQALSLAALPANRTRVPEAAIPMTSRVSLTPSSWRAIPATSIASLNPPSMTSTGANSPIRSHSTMAAENP